ncbi:DUF4394 domain-containing protein [Mucilaginibacter roseus]|uniref:DUF4394 domain-containing protein n=1 Tax=Mucilaginibacter roseus TaxID=1528868 RepID=A0ABS8U741_9SPHI|nr:DUF4394 domain-containing protein [Mucilaginibacter roseus]MCD8741930.1 DUF4394 domain-containing protein [Mucilaginibacter roseus]
MKTFNLYLQRVAMVCAAAILLITSSCSKDNDIDNSVEGSITGPDLAAYALTSNNTLVSFNAKNPSAATKTTSITGLQNNETLLGIDFRPATGELYGVGSTSRIYIINTQSGAARAIGTAAFTPAINGTAVGFDFNPTVDRIRLVTSSGQNLRLHPETGAVAFTDGTLNGAANASVTAAAYTQNKAGATTTELFVIDVANDKLYKQDPPNDGKLVEIGSLGVNVEQAGGFDISPDGKAALAALTVGGKTSLYSINITTGRATKIQNDFTGAVTGLAIPTEPVAYAVSEANELVIFNPMSPSPVAKAITGIAGGENILGIDFRPLNGQLYALGSSNRLYTINLSSGAAAVVGTAPFTTLLSGTQFGFDFNPTVDRIRVVSNTGQNLRLHPETGAVAFADGQLSPGSPSVTAAAYTSNFAGATSTVLFDIDTQNNTLYKQDPPNNGTLVSVGTLGVTATANSGFDIGSTSGTAYALLNVGGTTKVYSINLTTGAATAGATLAGNYKAFSLGLGF